MNQSIEYVRFNDVLLGGAVDANLHGLQTKVAQLKALRSMRNASSLHTWLLRFQASPYEACEYEG